MNGKPVARGARALHLRAAKLDFTLREMRIEDLEAVFHLGERAFRADLSPTLYRSWDVYEVTTLFNTDGDFCLVAENEHFGRGRFRDDERIVGFVLGTVMTRPGTAWRYGYVTWLCAHRLWRRAGVASRLLDELAERFAAGGVRIVMADTDPKNKAAVNFFRQRGFDQERKHVYLSTNLEHNPRYAALREKSRVAS
jgi:ribosomal protein S18 acetylase RimI-like enzyme